MTDNTSFVRADVWLWAARMYKTRSLAKQAIDGGKVELNGSACKPAKAVHVGDVLRLMRGNERVEVVVQDLSERRGPAAQAQALYAETPESVAHRANEAAMRRLHAHAPRPAGRPDKQDRRLLRDMKENPDG
ncbi:RNA-binding S4 domain-containing protein [Pinirhizobacter sp.]|jgi:ribosome-associated heat shock protein Hsp15|uniref:RNA-binding S4 domain-containing protein n=1 Tax=Pinirhizobacter sp. TaxID=2950432 RepID=UPI002F42A5EE